MTLDDALDETVLGRHVREPTMPEGCYVFHVDERCDAPGYYVGTQQSPWTSTPFHPCAALRASNKWEVIG